uniref:Uncharacterized protein n=1 Tax=Odontella aurita TaxID=265563 RepID=A0A7S4J602_9STRA|mmetsp:Transcript_39265/g.118104  ORF Transcript_39265/g.118104 Transcript_39265/m.118104 type:complete len:206 (+) Transcript_39265:91-708(+)
MSETARGCEKKGASPSPASAITAPPKDKEACSKCTKCHRKLGKNTLEACSQRVCLKCCTDKDCAGHREKRALAKKNDAILSGTSWVNRMAAEKRALAVKPGTLFREPAIHYLGETVQVWSLSEFFKVPKWREDAVRRSRKNRERMERFEGSSRKKRKRACSVASKKSRRLRASNIMEELYQKSLKNGYKEQLVCEDISIDVKSKT